MTTIKDLRPITPRTNGTRSLSAIKNIARHHSGGATGNWAAFWTYWNKSLGWGTGGYHEIILRDGTVELCYDPNEITNGVGGQNSYIYNICLVGSGSFTVEQEKTWEERARYWMQRLNLSVSAVKGHNEFPGQSTSCPGINMNTVRARLSGQASTSSNVTVLKYGDTSEIVRLHQDKFKRAGYVIDIDGKFGPSMKKVVRQFQKDNGLVVDGYHGPASQGKLDEILISLRDNPLKKEEVILPKDRPVSASHKEAWEWASSPQVKLMNGERPGDPLTREQFATVLKRYDEFKRG